MRFLCLVALVGSIALPANAYAYPSRWLRQAHCIHRFETRRPWSRGWHLTRAWGGAPSVNRGGLQINRDTWRAYVPGGWPRDPARASRTQQLLVAWRIFLASGRSWRQWSTARFCS